MIGKERSSPQLMPIPQEAFRGHPWYKYLSEFIRRGACELPNQYYVVVMAALERLGYDSKVMAGSSNESAILQGDLKLWSWYPDEETYAKMSVPERTLLDLGGNEFTKMTGSHDYSSDGNTLRMTLTRNISGANRLYITLQDDDLYTMRFFHYRKPKFKVDTEKGTVKETTELIREIELYDGVFGSSLRTLFSEVTGLDTHMPIVINKNELGV